jgi:hypothetical protein
MTFDQRLANRVRKALVAEPDLAEKRMFGGLAFMLRGHMCCGIVENSLMLRLGADGVRAALRQPHTREMDFTGKPMKTMVYVGPDGLGSSQTLGKWLRLAIAYSATLPPK